MVKGTCPFGPAFRREREARAISQWTLATKIHCHPRNLQRIEYGEQQPGVMKALQLLTAIGCMPGSFLEDLALAIGLPLPNEKDPLIEDSYTKPDTSGGAPCLFGPLLRQARESVRLSQTALAKNAAYNLRNINAVEAGRQEPGIIIALRLVVATGVNVNGFFDSLSTFMEEVT